MPAIVPWIDTGDVPVSYWPFFLSPVTAHKTNINTDAHVSTPRYGHYLSMAVTTGVIWLCASLRYWPYRGVGTVSQVLATVYSDQFPKWRILPTSTSTLEGLRKICKFI